MTIIYILYYILAYIQHNADVSLEKKKCVMFHRKSLIGIMDVWHSTSQCVECRSQASNSTQAARFTCCCIIPFS